MIVGSEKLHSQLSDSCFIFVQHLSILNHRDLPQNLLAVIAVSLVGLLECFDFTVYFFKRQRPKIYVGEVT